MGRQWTIYPFAFLFEPCNADSKCEDAIKLNWEHESWAWYNPAEVFEDESFGGVPRLAQSLRQVLFEMDMNQQTSQALQACLQELKTDHQSGSHELTSIALKGFRDILVHLKDDTQWWATARTAAWHIWKNGRESMGAATLNALLAILHDLESLLERPSSGEDWCDSALAMVDHHLAQRRLMPQRIKESFITYLQTQYASQEPREEQKLVILTLSASSTIRDAILDAFAAASTPHLDLRILESRPLFEGATMASSILTEFRTKFPLSSHQSLDLTIYTEASAALASRDVNLVLLGADKIASSGSVRNKTGSLPAILSAKHISPSAKVLVFSGLEKVAEPGTEDNQQVEENDASEVTSGWFASNVKGLNILDGELRGLQGKTANCSAHVRNIYFEWVPSDLIDAYICDEGILNRQKIQAEAGKVRMKRERYFQGV